MSSYKIARGCLGRYNLLTLDLTGLVVDFKKHPIETYVDKAIDYELVPREINRLERKLYVDTMEEDFKLAIKKLAAEHPHYGTTTNISVKKWWDIIVKEAFLFLKPDSTIVDKISEELFELYSTSMPYRVINFPLLDITTKLRAKKPELVVGAITNNDERIVKILSELKIDDYFDFILTSEKCRSSKPDSKIFHYAERLAGFDPSDVDAKYHRTKYLHIGDDFKKDYHGALKAGWDAYYLNTEPDYYAYLGEDIQHYVIEGREEEDNPDNLPPNPEHFKNPDDLIRHMIQGIPV